MVKATYGHGTHNDFVLVFDESDELKFSQEQIKRICDRKTGVGSDGFIRILKKIVTGLWITQMLMVLRLRCVVMA